MDIYFPLQTSIHTYLFSQLVNYSCLGKTILVSLSKFNSFWISLTLSGYVYFISSASAYGISILQCSLLSHSSLLWHTEGCLFELPEAQDQKRTKNTSSDGIFSTLGFCFCVYVHIII